MPEILNDEVYRVVSQIGDGRIDLFEKSTNEFLAEVSRTHLPSPPATEAAGCSHAVPYGTE